MDVFVEYRFPSIKLGL